MLFSCSNLLFLFDEVPESATDAISLISIAIVLLVVVAAILLCVKKRAFSSKELAFAGISISAGFLLSILKVTPVPNGGSVTLASMLPVMLFAYYYGFTHGLLVGAIFGLMQFIQSPYILTPATFALDYLLPFACIAFASIGTRFKNKPLGIVCGTLLTYVGRFLMHFLSGLVYFSKNAVWTTLPATSGALYSFLYQTVYLLPDMVITLVAFLLLYRYGVIDKLSPLSSPKNDMA